jgi:hypothetical protein
MMTLGIMDLSIVVDLSCKMKIIITLSVEAEWDPAELYNPTRNLIATVIGTCWSCTSQEGCKSS